MNVAPRVGVFSGDVSLSPMSSGAEPMVLTYLGVGEHGAVDGVGDPEFE